MLRILTIGGLILGFLAPHAAAADIAGKRPDPWLTAVAPSPAAVADAARKCPALPTGSRFAWVEHTEGADFDVCLAAEPGEPVRIGVYWGNWPSFQPRLGTAIGPGVVAGWPVTWYRNDAGVEHGLTGQQTLVTLNEAMRFVAHVWMFSGNERERRNELAFVKAMAIEPPRW